MIEKEKLLVLKVFYMGSAISKSYLKYDAINLVDSAISQLEERCGSEDQLRILFYILLKAEILRNEDKAITCRKSAKDLSESIGSDVFDYYMKVEEATQTKKEVHGIEKGIIADKGIRTTEAYQINDYYGNIIGWGCYDVACMVLDIALKEFSVKEGQFLYKMNLKEIIKKHGLK